VSNLIFYLYFSNCLGAIDGTHINVKVTCEDQQPWRNRKGGLSTNVLVACNFNDRIVYILPGWEGSTNDGRVFTSALTRGFVIPNGCYYLADAGYNSSQRLFVPYCGVRYHLQENTRAGLRPANYKELWNLRHS
jgi:hypothetical protein